MSATRLARRRAESLRLRRKARRVRDTEMKGFGVREVLDRYARRGKPGTRRVDRIYFRERILPFFEGRPIAPITRRSRRPGDQ